MLLAWVCNAFFSSFGSSNFWAQDQVTGTEAKGYFYENIIGMSTLNYETLRATRLVPENVGYSFLTWCIIYLCIAFGLKVSLSCLVPRMSTFESFFLKLGASFSVHQGYRKDHLL